MKRAMLAAALVAAGLGCRGGEEDELVARIGKAAITQSEFRRKVSEVSPDYQKYVDTPYGRKQFLQVLIREKLILEAARTSGVDQTPAFLDQMRRIREEEEAKVRAAREFLLARLWLDRLRETGVIDVSESEIADFHRKNPDEVKARHILMATSAMAEGVLKRIRAGLSFAAAAKSMSLDADTAVEGGAMQPAIRGEVIPELEVLFKMQVGELGGPVRSAFGYHILFKEGQRRPPFDSLKDRIRVVLEKKKLDDYLKSLQPSYRVEVLDAQFK